LKSKSLPKVSESALLTKFDPEIVYESVQTPLVELREKEVVILSPGETGGYQQLRKLQGL